jgi:hypothetical protein
MNKPIKIQTMHYTNEYAKVVYKLLTNSRRRHVPVSDPFFEEYNASVTRQVLEQCTYIARRLMSSIMMLNK